MEGQEEKGYVRIEVVKGGEGKIILPKTLDDVLLDLSEYRVKYEGKEIESKYISKEDAEEEVKGAKVGDLERYLEEEVRGQEEAIESLSDSQIMSYKRVVKGYGITYGYNLTDDIIDKVNKVMGTLVKESKKGKQVARV